MITRRDIVIGFNIIKDSPRKNDFIGNPKYDDEKFFSEKELRLAIKHVCKNEWENCGGALLGKLKLEE